ncbi:MAG: hypothetical protein ABII26_13245 [Pseudomonadota bacterium]
MAGRRKKTMAFENLTWSDLEAWAGNKIVARGKSYHRGGHVMDLGMTTDGKLVAWVQGSERYASLVYFEGGELESLCTCPYWADCKHAVATVLEYLDCIKKGRKIRQVGNNDQRLHMLLDDIIDDSPSTEEAGEGVDGMDESLDDFLRQQKKDDLIALINDLVMRYPDVRVALMDRRELAGGAIKGMVDRVRKEIRQLTAAPVYQDYWNDDQEDLPDYSRVRERLEALMNQGHAEEVLSLGKELLEAGTNQVGMSHDGGHLSWSIGECMEIVFKALPRSGLSTAEQMLWAVEAELVDKYSLCDTGLEGFWKIKRSKADWAILAEKLLERLRTFKPKKGDDAYSIKYLRERLTDWIVESLQMAGKIDEAIALSEKEAPITASYVRLVRLLREAGRKEDAVKWIQKGIQATQKQWPGIASDLREAFREMQEKDGNWLRVSAIQADDFFHAPSLRTFQSLEKAATKAKVWKEVRSMVMAYLETGEMPDKKESSWPLPETDLPKSIRRGREQFPLHETLIDIAIAEKRPGDVIKWHDAKPKGKYSRTFGGHGDARIAEAVKKHYPERAVEIWKGIAESEIAQTKVKSYQEAGKYLRKIQRLLKQHKREKDWQDYVSQLRQANARKPRFVEILDTLAGKRIMDL